MSDVVRGPTAQSALLFGPALAGNALADAIYNIRRILENQETGGLFSVRWWFQAVES